MNDVVNSGQQTVANVLLGCDPQLNVRITETDSGTLFVVIEPAEFDKPFSDIDGIFFDLADSSSLDSLNFFPESNTGSIFSPVTSVQAAADAVDTLSNGAQVSETYDVGIQFGTVDNSTAGEVTQVNFTLFGDNGPLSIEDLDLDSLAVVVDSDGGNGQVLTTDNSGDTDPAVVSTEVLFENFDDIHVPDDSDLIASDAGWDVRYGELFSNSRNEGELRLEAVESEGPSTISFDVKANVGKFEATGRYADEFRVEVRLDNGEWQTLDNFVVNSSKTALVGSETGTEITTDFSNVSYEVEGDGSVEYRIVTDVTAKDETIRIDNLEVTSTQVEEGGTTTQTTVVDFNDTNSGDVADGQFEGVTVSAQRSGDRDTSENDAMIFDTNNPTGGDHDLEFDDQGGAVIISEDNDSRDADDNAHGGTINFDFDVESNVQSLTLLDVEERGGTIELFNANGDLINTVDIPGAGDGSQQTIDINTAGVDSLNVNLVGSGAVDDLVFTTEVSGGGSSTGGGSVSFGDAVTVDFEGASSGDVVSNQFDGVTVSAQRDGDRDTSENDAMIFDSNNPTGGDHDLEYDDQGNILIISEDNDSSDADDEAHGGTISFEFETISEVQTLNVLDVEERGGTIELFDEAGDLINTVDIPAAGDNSSQIIEINTQGVASMDVNLVGSGAVDDLVYAPAIEEDAKGGQYDVNYIDGIPTIDPVEDDQFKDEDAAGDLDAFV